MTNAILVLLALFALIAFIILIVVLVSNSQGGTVMHDKALSSLSSFASNSGSRVIPSSESSWIERREEAVVRYQSRAGSKGHCTLVVSVEADIWPVPGGNYPSEVRVPFASVILLRTEHGRDRIGKLLTLNREIQTGDLDFDPIVYIESDAPDELVEAALGQPAVRRGVCTLLALGYDKVELYGPTAELAAYAHMPIDSLLAPLALESARDALVSIAQHMPRLHAEDPVRRGEVLPWFLIVMVAVTLGFFILAVFTKDQYHPLTERLWDLSVQAALGVYVIWMVGVIAWHRGRSTALRLMCGWAMVLAIALPLDGYFALRTANARLDAGEAQGRRGYVTKMWRSGKNRSNCEIELHVQGFEAPVELTIPCGTWRHIERVPKRPHREVRVQVRPGALGQPWMASIEP